MLKKLQSLHYGVFSSWQRLITAVVFVSGFTGLSMCIEIELSNWITVYYFTSFLPSFLLPLCSFLTYCLVCSFFIFCLPFFLSCLSAVGHELLIVIIYIVLIKKEVNNFYRFKFVMPHISNCLFYTFLGSAKKWERSNEVVSVSMWKVCLNFRTV